MPAAHFVAPLVQSFLAPAAHFVAPAFSSFLPPSSRHLPSCCISVSLTLLHRSFSALVPLCQCFLFLLHLSYPSPYCTTSSRSIVPALKFPLPFHQLEYHILARICEMDKESVRIIFVVYKIIIDSDPWSIFIPTVWRVHLLFPYGVVNLENSCVRANPTNVTVSIPTLYKLQPLLASKPPTF